MAFRSVKIIFRNSDGLSKTIYFKQNIGVENYPTPAPEPIEVKFPPAPYQSPIMTQVPVYDGENTFETNIDNVLPPMVSPKSTPAPRVEDLPEVTLPIAAGEPPKIVLPNIDLTALANLNLPPFDASQIKLDFATYPINFPKIGPINIPKNIGVPGPTGDAGAMKFNPILSGLMNSPFGGF